MGKHCKLHNYILSKIPLIIHNLFSMECTLLINTSILGENQMYVLLILEKNLEWMKVHSGCRFHDRKKNKKLVLQVGVQSVQRSKKKQQQKNNNLALTVHLFSFQSEVIGESVFNQIHTCLKQLNKSLSVIYLRKKIWYFSSLCTEM